jgi:hypothetical protein
MSERFAKIEGSSAQRKSIEERLKAHPDLKARFEAIMDIVENAGGDVEKADEAERRAIEELRQLGNEVLHGWARRQEQKKEDEFDGKREMSRKVKKTSTGSRFSGRSK